MPRIIEAALAKAVTVPSATIHAHVERLRRKNPEATPEEIIRLLEREYLLVVQSAGGAVGAAAAAPAVGTTAAFVLTSSDVATFFASSAAFALGVASVHGIEIEDHERRRSLLLTTVLGDSGAKAVADITEMRAGSTARLLLTRLPISTVKRVNTALTRKMIRTQLGKQTGVALGRMLPYGVGFVVGIGGARALGKTVIKGARAAFGPPPPHFPRTIETDASPLTIDAPGRPLLPPTR
ncbi:hypothetical protein [Cellulomonas massiliensis]|uniref:hypothetical protein n=1 Tax=Cellulomonas massiliensis TaxID=1465811 RepID=UPI000319DF13|nr:hypothetical protein [Cellulomonas massiliensis]